MIARISAALLALTITCSTAVSQVIQLARGQTLVGEVQDATSDGLTFRRLDNGGVLELGWDDLSSQSAEKIRRLKGLLVEDESEPMVDADVIIYAVAGGIRQEIVGRIVEETDTTFTMRRKGAAIPVQRASIKNRKKRSVPIFEIYTKEGYYQEQHEQFAPGEDADKHIGLADQLRRVGDYDNAEKHLLQAQSLGGGKQRNQLDAMLTRVQVLKESAAERDMLAKIRHKRNRKDFAGAKALMEEFETTYADSQLLADLEREKRRWERDRKRNFIDRMRTMWDRTIHTLSNAKTADAKLSLSAAREYAEGKMADDMFDHLASALDTEADEVRELWQERSKYGTGRSTIYNYGVGSWVLGEDEIIKGTKVEQGKQDQLDSDTSDPELQRIKRMIREHKKRARQLARQRQGQGEESDESWWKKLKLAQKRQWLRVYFAEYGGQMEITAAHAAPCGNCNGQGQTTTLGSAGRPQKSKCPVCHGTKYTRLVRAR